jgi:hypothetical protein
MESFKINFNGIYLNEIYLVYLYVITLITIFYSICKVKTEFDFNNQISKGFKIYLFLIFIIYITYLYSLFFILYSLYNGYIFKNFKILSLFNTIYCDSQTQNNKFFIVNNENIVVVHKPVHNQIMNNINKKGFFENFFLLKIFRDEHKISTYEYNYYYYNYNILVNNALTQDPLNRNYLFNNIAQRFLNEIEVLNTQRLNTVYLNNRFQAIAITINPQGIEKKKILINFHSPTSIDFLMSFEN